MLPLDVGELGVDVAADLGMTAQLAGEELEAVGDVLVAPASAESAVLAVQQRGGFLAMRLRALQVAQARDVVERRAGVGLAHHPLDLAAGAVVAGDVKVPGGEVGDD